MAVLGTFVSDLLLSFRHNFLFHADFSDDTNYKKKGFMLKELTGNRGNREQRRRGVC